MRVLSVNVGVPRVVSWTRRTEATADGFAAIASTIPLGRAAGPGEISAAIVFVASDMASYVNGAVIPVDGGHMAAAGVHQSLAKERA